MAEIDKSLPNELRTEIEIPSEDVVEEEVVEEKTHHHQKKMFLVML